MKFAGVVLCFIGGWAVATMVFAFVAGLHCCEQPLPYAQRLQAVAPYVALLAGAIGVCVIGAWLYNKERE